MKSIIRKIYNNAISKVFSSEMLISENFDSACYMEMIDDSHSIVIWGNEDSDCEEIYRDFIISIRDGATVTEDRLSGKKTVIEDETLDNTYKSLYLGVKNIIESYFKSKR